MASPFSPPYTRNYEGAKQFLAGKPQKRIAHNAVLRQVNDNCIALVLHYTEIVQYHSNGMIVVQNGGWSTATTRRYINGAAPCHISQRDFAEYLDGKPWDGGPTVVA